MFNIAKERMLRFGILIASILLLLPACSGSLASRSEAREVIVTRDDTGLPEGCSPAEVAELVMGFLDAYNNGNQEKLANLFAFGRDSWFSDTIEEGENFTAYTETKLLDYVAEREQHSDHLQLVAVDVAGPGWHGGADIAFRLMRQADDLNPDGRNRYVEGGGAMYCQLQQVMVWGMGTRPPDFPESELARICPDPPADAPENAVIACARG